MPKSKYADKSIAELRDEYESLSKTIDSAKAERREVALAIEAIEAVEAAATKVANMGDAEKQALAQVLKAEGIKPTSAVGTPGGN